jgi:hypothetical protein
MKLASDEAARRFDALSQQHYELKTKYDAREPREEDVRRIKQVRNTKWLKRGGESKA